MPFKNLRILLVSVGVPVAAAAFAYPYGMFAPRGGSGIAKIAGPFAPMGRDGRYLAHVTHNTGAEAMARVIGKHL